MVSSIFQKGKNLLTGEQNGILSTAVLLMILNLITKFAGFFFLAIAASALGANRSSDLFFAANTLPELISNVILFGAISVSVVPVLIDVLQKSGEQTFLKVLNSVLNISLVVFTLLSIILAVTADSFYPYFLEKVINPVEPYSADELGTIIQMTRLLLIPQIILGISTFISSALYAKNRVIMPQIAPLFYNFGRIVGTVVFIAVFDMGVWGLVWATVLGAVFHLVIQIPLAFNLGVKYLPVAQFKNRYVKMIAVLGFPRIVSLATEHIAITVDQFIALGLVAGSATTFYFAVRLVSIPLGLFGTTFAIASFPALSNAFSSGRKDEFSNILHTIINYIFYLAIPTTIVLLVLRVSLVRLTFGAFDRNTFGLESTYMTAWVVLFFSFGLAFESLRTVIYRAFYAAHDSLRPFISAIFVVLTGIISGILFTNYFSHFDTFSVKALTLDLSFFLTKSDGKAAVGGLALSSSIVYFLEFLLLLFMLNKKVVEVRFGQLLKSLGKKIIAAFVMAITMYSLFRLWDDISDTSRTINLLILTATTIFAGLMTYVWMGYLIRDPDVGLIVKLIRRVQKVFTNGKTLEVAKKTLTE